MNEYEESRNVILNKKKETSVRINLKDLNSQWSNQKDFKITN